MPKIASCACQEFLAQQSYDQQITNAAYAELSPRYRSAQSIHDVLYNREIRRIDEHSSQMHGTAPKPVQRIDSDWRICSEPIQR